MRNGATAKGLASLFCGWLVASTGVTPAGAAPNTGLTVEWRSETRDGTELALALEQLYVVLYNTGNLRTIELTDPADTSRVVVDLLRSRGLFFGEFLPAGVDAVMCDLNPEVCKRAKGIIAGSELGEIDDHVGGYRKTQGRWSNGPETHLRVPDLSFERYTTIADVPYRKGDNIDDIGRNRQVDCSQFGVSCQEVVQRLNRSLFDPRRDRSATFVTRLKVPVNGLKSELVLSNAEGSRLQRSYNDLNIAKSQTVDASPGWERGFSEEYKAFLRGKSPTDLAFAALKNNLLSFGKSNVQSVADAQFRIERPLLELIHHPLATSDSFDDALKRPVAVAVFDTRFDKDHCELKDSVEADDSLAGQTGQLSDRPVSTECGALRDDVSVAEDHGTHVAGLISASMDQHGVVGLAPYVKLKYVSLDATSLQGPDYRNLVALKMLSMAFTGDNPVKIANVSWQYSNQANLDVIKNAMASLEQSTLFVVAAGNSNKELSRNGCGEYPSCFGDLGNVIVVGGLDRSNTPPKLWTTVGNQGSNWGGSVSLGAVAEDVLSTTARSYTGRMSGTSQAAPQVTAAAALLYSVYKTHHEIDAPVLLPIRIKNRLIYTSDLFNELLTKSQGGRLNIQRALETASDQVQITVNNETKFYKGKLTKFGNFPVGSEYVECRQNTGRILHIQYSALRRMFLDSFRQKYIIFYNSVADNRDSPLLRITDCDLTTRTHEVVFEPAPGGSEIRFQFRDIQDYVSNMF
jgi:subtilisin family serine protease